MRAPRWTARPSTPVSASSISPVWSPARISIPSPRTASRIAQAHRIARAGPSNVARKPSPAIRTSLPRNRSSRSRTSAWCSREERRPAPVAELGGVLGRADDVREEHGREHAVRLAPAARAGQELLDLVERRARLPPGTGGGRCLRARRTSRPGCARRGSARPRPGSPGRPARWITSVGTRIAGRTSRMSISIVTRNHASADDGVPAKRQACAYHCRNRSSSTADGASELRPKSPRPHLLS